jgi:hypothetical protein
MNETEITNRVYYPGSDVPLTPLQLARETDYAFGVCGFPGRLSGSGFCDCAGGGEFELYPKDDPDVISGGKRYMKCRVCGGVSHL